MFVAPSIKSMVDKGLEKDVAIFVRQIIKDNTNWHDYNTFCDNASRLQDVCPKTYSWIRSCYNMPSNSEVRLHMIDEVLDGFGIEVIQHKKGYTHYCYVNNGDTYAPTIIYNRLTKRFLYCGWGDLVKDCHE